MINANIMLRALQRFYSVIKRLQEKQQGDFEIHACFTVEMLGGKRWCFMAFASFVLCPRTSKSMNIHSKPFAPRRTLNLVNDKGSSLRLEEAEPGFDFNDDEMKKLKIWPGGAIPYYIDEFSFDKVFRDRIRNFLDVTNSLTGLNFLELYRPPGDDESRWVFFVNRQGLLSCVDHPYKNFTSKGVQKILLGYDCLSNGGELAEVILALVGVPPQHNAPNRNNYIEIIKENIMPGKAHLFEIVKDNEWLFHEINYDFASAGHYNLHKYTVNGIATIKPLGAVKKISIGEGKGFSYTDIWKIRMIYNYISKKRMKSVSLPECNKLFNLGTNFSNYVHESEEDVQPRKKPNKYLGLQDLPLENPSDNQETNNTISSTPNIPIDEEVIEEETNSKKEHDIKNKTQKDEDSNEKIKNSSEIEVPPVNSNTEHDERMTDENLSNFKEKEAFKSRVLKFKKPGHKG